MSPEISQIEEERRANFNRSMLQSERENNNSENEVNSLNPISFGKRAMQHWPIWLAAAFFDLLGLVPFLGIVSNFCFGVIMFFYFGRKKVVTGIIAPILIGSIIDFLMSFFLVGLWPTNLGAVFTRIMLKEVKIALSV